MLASHNPIGPLGALPRHWIPECKEKDSAQTRVGTLLPLGAALNHNEE